MEHLDCSMLCTELLRNCESEGKVGGGGVGGGGRVGKVEGGGGGIGRKTA